MSIPAITLPPVLPSTVSGRSEAKAPASTPAPAPQTPSDPDVVSTSTSTSGHADLEAFLKDMADRGFIVTPMNEGAARAMADEAGEALGALSLSIANANPDRLASLFVDGD